MRRRHSIRRDFQCALGALAVAFAGACACPQQPAGYSSASGPRTETPDRVAAQPGQPAPDRAPAKPGEPGAPTGPDRVPATPGEPGAPAGPDRVPATPGQPGTPTAPDRVPATPGQPATVPSDDTPGQGQPCPENHCADGLTCVSYYGIAGARGPKFTSCEIPCAGRKDACPSGQACITIADGPGQVCRPQDR